MDLNKDVNLDSIKIVTIYIFLSLKYSQKIISKVKEGLRFFFLDVWICF